MPDPETPRTYPRDMPRPDRALLAIACLAFASLGLPDAVLGIAWPSMRRSFGLMLSELGTLLAAAMAGYLVSAFSSGALVARLGVGRLLLGSSAAMVAASLGYALAPAWPAVVALGVLTGLGAGAIDAGINAFAAARFRPRQVTWLHACYGVGAMLGPLLMTAVLAQGGGWRWGYGVIGMLLAATTGCFALTMARWDAGTSPDADEATDARDAAGARGAGILAALRHPPVWVNVAVFFAYTGLEASAGQWSYTLLTESRDVALGVAGTAVSAYWGSLTAGRLVVGAVARRHAPERLLGLAVVAAPLAAALVWLLPGAGGVAGLAVLGFVLGPIYPLLISLTPARVGAAHTAHAVGFQVAAAYLGAAALPGGAGILAHALGLEAIGPFMVATALAVLALHVVASRRGPGATGAPRSDAAPEIARR